MCSISLKSGSGLVVVARLICRTTSSCFGSSPRDTTVREMGGPSFWVTITFFFSAACAEKLRETTTNASAGSIKVAVTRAHTLRMLLWRDGEFIPLVSRNLQYRIKEN